jgi:hypothetical protein
MTKKARPGDVQAAQASATGSPKKEKRRPSKSKRPSGIPSTGPSTGPSSASPSALPAGTSAPRARRTSTAPASSKRGRSRRTASSPELREPSRFDDQLSANHAVMAPANESELDQLAADRCAEHEAPRRPSEALRAAARAASAGFIPHEDDVSIPPAPVGLDDLDAHDEHFFLAGDLASKAPFALSRGRRPAHAHAHEALHAAAGDESVLDFEEDFPDRRLIQLASPATRARRAHFTRYVKGGMAVAAMLCIAAFVRVTVAGLPGRDADAVGTSAAVQIEPVANAAEHAPFSPIAPATAVAAAEIGARIPAPPPEPVAASEPAIAEMAVVEIAAVEKPAKTAAEEKRDARSLLERYNAKDAIEAAERSVALDPTDGDAWLILGAAYQEVGQLDGARRAFQACLKQAKRGPVGECRAMLQ